MIAQCLGVGLLSPDPSAKWHAPPSRPHSNEMKDRRHDIRHQACSVVQVRRTLELPRTCSPRTRSMKARRLPREGVNGRKNKPKSRCAPVRRSSRCREHVGIQARRTKTQPILDEITADVHAAELHGHAGHGPGRPRQIATHFSGHGVAAAVRGYFGHALETDEQPLRRTGRRAGRAGARRPGGQRPADPASSCSAVTQASARPGWSSELEQRLSCGRGGADGAPGSSSCGGERRAGRRRAALRPVAERAASAGPRSPPGARRADAPAAGPAGHDPARPRRGRPYRDERADAAGQLRLFEAVLELLDVLSEREPLVLMLEDMHWADRSTRTFVAFLARSLRQERVMLLLTYRTDELHRRHPLRPLLGRARAAGARPPHRAASRSTAPSCPRRWPTSSARRPTGPCSSVCSRAARATRCTPRSCWPPGWTVAAPRRRACATRSWSGSSACRPRPSAWPGRSPSAARWTSRRSSPSRAASATRVQAALREAVAEQVLVARRGRALRLSPRAAARGAVRRSAARRARRAAPGAGPRLEAAPAQRRRAELERTTTVASHYAAAGDQPAALRSTSPPRRPPSACSPTARRPSCTSARSSCGRASPDAERPAGVDHVELLARRPARTAIAGDRDRAPRVCCARRCEELDPDRGPGPLRRAAGAAGPDDLVAEPGAGGGGDRRAGAGHAARGRPAGVRPCCWPGWPGRAFCAGASARPIATASVALAAAVAAGDRAAETEVLNTLGMAQVAPAARSTRGSRGCAGDRGGARGRRARQPGHRATPTWPTCSAWPGAPGRRWRSLARGWSDRRAGSRAATTGCS